MEDNKKEEKAAWKSSNQKEESVWKYFESIREDSKKTFQEAAEEYKIFKEKYKEKFKEELNNQKKTQIFKQLEDERSIKDKPHAYFTSRAVGKKIKEDQDKFKQELNKLEEKHKSFKEESSISEISQGFISTPANNQIKEISIENTDYEENVATVTIASPDKYAFSIDPYRKSENKDDNPFYEDNFDKINLNEKINSEEELIVNIEELADELAELELKNKENTDSYSNLLEKYKKLILKHERKRKI